MKKISKEDLINNLLSLHKLLNRVPRIKDLKYGKYSINTYYRSFGNFSNALRATGCHPRPHGSHKNLVPPNKISDQNLLNNLIHLKKRFHNLKASDLKYGKYSVNAYRRAFGSFTNALIRAGLKVNIRLKISNEEIIKDLKRVYNLFKRPFSHKEFVKYNKSVNSRGVIRKRFGSWAKAMELIGVKPIRSDTKTNKLNKDELIQDVKLITAQIKRTPKVKEYVEYSNLIDSPTEIYKLFGTWNDLLEIANIQIVKRRTLDLIELKESLKKWVKINNNDLSYLSYWNIYNAKKSGKLLYSTAAIKLNFPGFTWEEIMQELGFNYYTQNQYYGRHIHVGKDNNEYLSFLEKVIGDILFEFKYNNSIKNYYYEAKICENRLWTCDFKTLLLNNTYLWIEADGMYISRTIPYNSGENEKIEYYKTNNFNYLIITWYTKDIQQTIKNNILE